METSLKSNIRIMRLLGRDLVPSDCDVTIHLSISAGDDSDLQERSLKAIKFFIENCIDCSISYWPGTAANVELFEHLSNNILFTPEEPNDYHMCLLLHSKLNAIGRGHITISKTEFTSDTSEGFTCSISGPLTEGWLPTNEEWMGTPTIFDRPWWERPDGSTIDIPFETGDNIIDIRKNLTVDLIDMLNDSPSDDKSEMAEIIKPSFKLKLVKDDE